jgi:hypothetical protein
VEVIKKGVSCNSEVTGKINIELFKVKDGCVDGIGCNTFSVYLNGAETGGNGTRCIGVDIDVSANFKLTCGNIAGGVGHLGRFYTFNFYFFNGNKK